jgi:yeast amino acid transporter
MPATASTSESLQIKPALFCKAGSKRVHIQRLMRRRLIIPYITYGFLGVETITVAAFEARNPRSLRSSAKWIAYVITFLFILCAIGQILNISWTDQRLPELVAKRDTLWPRDTAQVSSHYSLLVLSAEITGHKSAAGVWNGFLILSSLSAANTCLYVASRTLYGLCRDLPQDKTSLLRRWPAKLGHLDPRTRVPFWALIASTAAFFWLPFLHLQSGTSAQDVSSSYSTSK